MQQAKPTTGWDPASREKVADSDLEISTSCPAQDGGTSLIEREREEKSHGTTVYTQ